MCVSCLLHVTFPVLVDMQRSANTAYTRSVDLWPVLSPLHAHLAFYLKTRPSRWALARVSIVCLLPWSRSVVLLLFFSLAWMSLIQPDSYITFPVPSDISSSHISMSKHTHLPLPLSWIDSGLCPPTFPPLHRVASPRGHFLHISTRGHTEKADTHWLPRPVKNELSRGNKLHPI